MVKIKMGTWLRPEDVKNDEVVTIIDEGQIRRADETPFGREIFEIGVRLPSGEERIWTMNKTTQRRCAEAWGDDTSNWVGKSVKIELQEQNVRGLVKRVLYGAPIKEERKIETKPETETSEGMVTLTLTKEEAERLVRFLKSRGHESVK